MQTMSRLSAWTAWLLATLFYAYQYIIRVSPNVMMQPIMAKFGVDASQFGDFCGRYYIGYCLMHIPIGILLDRIGPRIVMPICVLITAAGMLPLIYAETWVYPVIGRILIGMGSSGAILGLFKVIRMGFPESQFNRVFGWSVTVGLLGAIYGGQPVHAMLKKLGWDQVILLIGGMGIVLAVAMVFLCPKHITTQDETTHSIWQDILTVLKNFKILALCIFGGLMIGPLEGFADGWAMKFLKTTYNLTDDVAAFLPSLIFLGLCIGSPIYAYITDRTRAYYTMLVVSALALGLGFISMLYGCLDRMMLTIFFPLIGFFSMYQMIVIYKATVSANERLVGLVSAYANMIIMFFGTIFHSGIGRIMNTLWDGTKLDGAPVFSASTYLWALAIIPIGQLIAAAGFSIIGYLENRK